jgi:hypothetical protein
MSATTSLFRARQSFAADPRSGNLSLVAGDLVKRIEQQQQQQSDGAPLVSVSVCARASV